MIKAPNKDIQLPIRKKCNTNAPFNVLVLGVSDMKYGTAYAIPTISCHHKELKFFLREEKYIYKLHS